MCAVTLLLTFGQGPGTLETALYIVLPAGFELPYSKNGRPQSCP